MTAKRSRAYGRLMRAIRDADSRVLGVEHERALREATDTLVFASEFGEETQMALAGARAALLAIRDGSLAPWVDQLADDLEDCGPARVALITLPMAETQRTRRRRVARRGLP